MNKKILEAMKKVPATARAEKWVFTLNRDEGALFYSPTEIPSGSELHQVTDETALYTDKNFNPTGIMIEYFGYNFVEHHPEFKNLAEKVFDEDKGEVAIADPQDVHARGEEKDDVALFRALLENTLVAEAFTEPVVGQ